MVLFLCGDTDETAAMSTNTHGGFYISVVTQVPVPFFAVHPPYQERFSADGWIWG